MYARKSMFGASHLLACMHASSVDDMQITPKLPAIWEYMKAKDISRDELARRIGVNRITAYRVERGDVSPSPKFIAGLMVETGKKFEDLFEITESAAA